MIDQDVAVTVRNLSKRFGDVQANDRISLTVKRGSIHGIVGENGAGKSTLLKMLFGFYTPDSGEIWVKGQKQDFAKPSDAMAVGLGMVHQHFMLVEPFTVLENIMMGVEDRFMLRPSKQQARKKLKAIEQAYGFNLPLDEKVENLSVGVRQQVEILKALYRGAEILILDEPTAVLTPQETEQLFKLVEQLSFDGKTVLFVTHKLNEIMEVTDRVTVIRAGCVVSEVETADTNPGALAELMVGRRIVRQIEREPVLGDREMIRLEKVSADGENGRRGLVNVSLSVRKGQVLGVAGVAGNGQTELLEVLTGLRQVTGGAVQFDGVPTNTVDQCIDPITLRRMGLGHVAEDRLKLGAVESMTAAENVILGYHREPEFTDRGLLKRDAIAEKAAAYFETQDVRPNNPNLEFGSFSGGNQQKIVFAREIAHSPGVLIIGQPTRGVDIGAVTRIHDQITALRNAGKAILVVSADLDELLAVSDRIAVMSEGELVGIVPADEADEETLGLMMAGQKVAAYAPQGMEAVPDAVQMDRDSHGESL